MLGWELPPYNSGGLGVACYNLCKALSAYDVDMEFVLPYYVEHDIDFMRIVSASPQGVRAVLRSGIAYDSNTYVMQDGSKANLNIFDQQQLYEHGVEEIASSRSFDIVHAHDWLTFRAGLRAKELLGCPLVVHVHSIEADRAGGYGGNSVVRDIEETAFHLADRVIAVSDFTRQAIVREYKIPVDRIEVVHNSIDPVDASSLDVALPTTYQYLAALRKQGYRVVANVGRLTIQKGLPNLLRAAQIVVAHHPKAMFLLVGSGEQYNELIQLAADLGIAKHVIFTDFQRGKPWRDAYAIADLFVLPSVSEPFGLTPLEAIGYGTPVLISKQSGVSEVLHSALKVDAWDVQEMANQIISVLQNDALRDELLENATAELQKLSWREAAAKVCDIYRRHLVGAVAV